MDFGFTNTGNLKAENMNVLDDISLSMLNQMPDQRTQYSGYSAMPNMGSQHNPYQSSATGHGFMQNHGHNSAVYAPKLERADILSQATHAELLGAQNKAHTSLYEAFIGLKHDKAYNQQVIAELKLEIKTLSEAKHERVSSHYHTHGQEDTAPAKINVSLVIPPPHPSLPKPTNTNVFWTKGSWDKHLAAEKAANREPVWNSFITDENGAAMPREWHRQVYEEAKIAFNSLYFRRLDPPTWSKKHDTAAQYFFNTMRAKFPQFCLCEDNWKLKAWATKRYSDWTKNVRDSGGLLRADPSFSKARDKRPLDNARAEKTAKRPRVTIKQEPGTSRQPVEVLKEVINIDSDEHDSSDDWYVSDLEAKSTTNGGEKAGKKMDPVSHENQEPAKPRMSTPLSGQQSEPDRHQSPVTPLTSKTGPPDAPTEPRSKPSPHADDPPASLRTTPLLSAPTAKLPQSSTGRPVRQKRGNLNPLANLSVPDPAIAVPEPAVPEASANVIRKTKGLNPSTTSLTARNLFMIDYKAAHPDDTLEQFNEKFKSLEAEKRKLYDAKSKELKAAKETGPLTAPIIPTASSLE